jgi:hypothetical protein
VVAERISPSNQETISIAEHLRIVKEKDQKIQQLRRQLRFRDELDSVPSKVMSQNHKAALNKALMTYQEEEKEPDGKALLRKTEELAKSVGMSTKTFQKALSYCDSIGILEKETKAIRDEETGGVKYMETRIKPTERASYPKLYEAGNPRNHGGDRLMCKCGSEHIKKKVSYICMDCGEVHSEPPRYYPPDDQFGIQVPQEQEYEHEQETEEGPNSETAIVEGFLGPDDQFGIQVGADDQIGMQEGPNDQFGIQVFSPDQKANLTLLSNNKNLLDQVGIQVEGDSNKDHPDVSASPDHDTIIKDWLNIRRGSDPIITATGKIEDPRGKYIYQAQGYEPDLDKYMAGDTAHIYGSRLLDPETGLTQILCFEIDKAEHDAQAGTYLLDLSRAGAAPIYWARYANDRNRGHLELYFDRPVDPDVARAWAIEVCPDLEDIPEVFPCKVPQDKRKQALSWPLWMRIDQGVYPCTGIAMLPAPHDGGLLECEATDLESLSNLITDAVTPAALVEEFATVLAEREKLQPSEKERENAGDVLFIGIVPKPSSPVQSDSDLVPQVLADFDTRHDWNDIAAMAGGLYKGFFRATWRGEKTASVRPDKDGRYACDYGNHGSFPKKFDRYGAYCLIQGIDQKADLAERCAELRRQQSVTTFDGAPTIADGGTVTPIVTDVTEVPIQEPATELFPTEQTQETVYYTPCLVCGKPKSVLNASGALTCGTDHSKED